MDNSIFNIPSTIVGTREWEELEKKENSIGLDELLDEILNKRLWTNTEILWILKKMIYFYGKKESLLKSATQERLMQNMVDVLRCFYIIFDIEDPELDDNMRSYLCSKLTDSTWGISPRTRKYLYKIKNND